MNGGKHELGVPARSAYAFGTACMVVVVACPCTLLIGLLLGNVPLPPAQWGALVGGLASGSAALIATALHPQDPAPARRLRWVIMSALICGAMLLILVQAIGPRLDVEIKCMPECVRAPEPYTNAAMF